MTNPTDGRWTSLGTFSGRLGTSDLLSVVSPGNAASGINYGLPFGNLATNIASSILPNAATGTILFGQGVSTAPSFVPVGGDIGFTNNAAVATATITTHAVTFAKMQQIAGLSVAGVAGTATADMAAITGATDQVLRVAANGTTLGFGPVNLTAAALTGVLQVPFGGTGTTTLTVNRVLIGNGTTTLAFSNVATTGLALIGNGTAAAPGFAVLGVPGGGTNTTTLTAFGVVYGNGTSTVGITAAGGTGLPLVGAGGATAPSFAILGVSGGGIGTGTTTPFAVLTGGTTATSQVQSLATTGSSGTILTSQGATAQPIWSAAGAGTVTQVNTGGVVSGGPITTTGTVTVTAAAQSDMTTATSTTLVVTPARQQFHPSAAKFWVSFNGANGSTLVGYNVGSVTRNSTGNYNVNLTVAFATSEYVCTFGVARAGGANGFVTTDFSVNSSGLVRLLTTNSAFTPSDMDRVWVVGYGTQ